jgi:Transposase DDE domain group 1
MLRATNIVYDVADRVRATGAGGIGAMHLLAQRTGLVEAIDGQLHLLKIHLPYHESDHVLNIAYNLLCGGQCLEDIELWRNDEAHLDALGAQRIPDPTTAGDFCRRFTEADIETLQTLINETRLKVWQQQDRRTFFEEAVIDVDGTLASTTGECKEGMNISYEGQWGYHPLMLSLANTREPLFLDNRSGNRPSHEGAARRIDQVIQLCQRAGFESVLIRGDTDFTQSKHLDRWSDQPDVWFLFGIDAHAKLVNIAENLKEKAWRALRRPVKYDVKTQPRARPENVKERIVVEREFKNIRLISEQVAAFEYTPSQCKKSYRVVAVRKNLSVEKGQAVLFDDVRYFFYITNDRTTPADQLVTLAHGRCEQENLIEQLKNGVKALNMPVDNLVSNGAYMVMASLAWTLKAWLALLLPENGRWGEKYRQQKQQVLSMEFRQFVNGLMRVPAQIVRTGGRIVYRLLSWNPWQEVLLRAADALRRSGRVVMRC